MAAKLVENFIFLRGIRQGRRRALKSGTAIERLWPSAEGTSGGEHDRGSPPLVRGVRGKPSRNFLNSRCMKKRF